jgi:DNA mismatch endonuclease (patch repair protein)
MPKTNKAFWKKNFERSVSNDRKHARQLRKLGWKVVIIWSCQLKRPERVIRRVAFWAGSGISPKEFKRRQSLDNI